MTTDRDTVNAADRFRDVADKRDVVAMIDTMSPDWRATVPLEDGLEPIVEWRRRSHR